MEHLLNFTCKEIETDYSIKFGVYEYKIDEYELKIRKTRRMIQAAVEDMNPAAVQALEMTPIMESTALSDL